MSVTRNVLLALAVTAGVCAFSAGASAGTFTVAPLTLASGPSPFAGCTVGAAPVKMQRVGCQDLQVVRVGEKVKDFLERSWQPQLGLQCVYPVEHREWPAGKPSRNQEPHRRDAGREKKS